MTKTWNDARTEYKNRLLRCTSFGDALATLERLGAPPPDEVGAAHADWASKGTYPLRLSSGDWHTDARTHVSWYNSDHINRWMRGPFTNELAAQIVEDIKTWYAPHDAPFGERLMRSFTPDFEPDSHLNKRLLDYRNRHDFAVVTQDDRGQYQLVTDAQHIPGRTLRLALWLKRTSNAEVQRSINAALMTMQGAQLDVEIMKRDPEDS